ACAYTDYPHFLADLMGAVDAAFVHLSLPVDREAILVANVVQARGAPFRAVAVLGLAEGEFPTSIHEDPFLRDADRAALQALGCELLSSTDSAEAEYAYEGFTRPGERLLLTRPRIADNGAPWQASPFWEEVRRRVAATPQTTRRPDVPTIAEAASWPELLRATATRRAPDTVPWALERDPERWTALEHRAGVVRARTRPLDETSPGDRFEGNLAELSSLFAKHFGPEQTWSASRVETYRTCPFFFFVSHVLKLEPLNPPAAGLDSRQLGNIYHHILEAVYKAVDDSMDLAALLAALPEVARRILDEAPRREQFRVTAWWTQTREEIVRNIARSLEALHALAGDFIPWDHEAAFGKQSNAALVIKGEGDSFSLRGYIDRVDRTPGGKLRIIDYKTAGPGGFTQAAVRDGKKLQLPLYALAARDALALGEPIDGFYWHVRHAEPSSFTLAKMGCEDAIETAVAYAWEAIRNARRGTFPPHPPNGGCPAYCPAAAFCWRYEASSFGR
ncbi:MAG: PD-(D/E)XK nuclease family protein, partial [Anaerolineae bacterium]|nr:PD-(D/E)XK nuclease family protein [Anaerolineae bacterium]